MVSHCIIYSPDSIRKHIVPIVVEQRKSIELIIDESISDFFDCNLGILQILNVLLQFRNTVFISHFL